MLKTKQTLTALLLSTLLSSGAMAAEKADKQFIDDSSYAVGVLMGKNIEGVMESQKDVFTYNQDKILDGVKDTLKKTGKLTDEDLQKQLKSLDTYLSAQEEKILAEKNKGTIEAGDKFRADYAKKDGVKKTANGVLYKVENLGEGSSPTLSDTVKVHYKGTLVDGSVFDSSYDRGQPIEFKLDNLIPAWKEVIPMLKKGGKMQIVVPPEQGYGSRAAGKIPPNSTLVFDIELLDFHSDAK